MIDRNSPLTFHYQLEKILTDQIEHNELKVGSQLPTEMELCEKYEVSRAVVRQVLTSMLNKGLIVRFRGKGTFVAEKKVKESMFQKLTGFHQDMVAQGFSLYTEVLNQKIEIANQLIASFLNVSVGSPVIFLERLRYIDDEPIVLISTYLPFTLCPGVLTLDLRNRSLYEYLEKECKLTLARGRNTIGASLANTYQARCLQIKPGSALVEIDTVTYLNDGAVIEYSHQFHRGDRSRFEVELIRGNEEKSATDQLDANPDIPHSTAIINNLK